MFGIGTSINWDGDRNCFFVTNVKKVLLMLFVCMCVWGGGGGQSCCHKGRLKGSLYVYANRYVPSTWGWGG